MSSSSARIWEGEEWEAYIKRLLKCHYGSGNYQDVPARHKGDFGIEGYSTTDGCAYQCYAAQEPCTVQHRYESQRNKITTDINKFVYNKNDLKKVFGETLIRRWILMVPISESAQLIQHASKKTEEVIRASLPYVSGDFKIIIETDLCFEKEINELAYSGVLEIEIPDLNVCSKEAEIWLGGNENLLQNLDRKSRKIPDLADENRIYSFRQTIVEHYIRGQNYLDLLYNKYPDIHAQISNCKSTYEYHLMTMSLINDSSSNQYLKESLEDFGRQISSALPYQLPLASNRILQWEAISDWLMRCPIDFN